MIRRIAAVCLCVTVCECAGTSTSERANPGALSERDARVLKSVDRDYFAGRAREELCELARRSDVARLKVVELLQKDNFAVNSGVLLRAVVRAGPPIVPVITNALRDANEDTGLESLLLALGRLGAQARAAAPFVQEKINDSSLSPRMKVTALVSLCSIGCCTATRLSEVNRLIAEHDEPAKTAIQAMATMGSVSWVDSETVRALSEFIKDRAGSDAAIFAASVIAMAVQKPETCQIAPVRDAFQHAAAATGRHVDAFWYGLCIARMDPATRKDTMRSALVSLNSEWCGGKLPAALCLLAPVLVTPDMQQIAVAFLDDDDAGVVEGAAGLLQCVGGPAPDAAEKLLSIAKRRADHEVRACALMAWVTLASNADLQRMHAVATGSPEANEELLEAINDWDTVDHPR